MRRILLAARGGQRWLEQRQAERGRKGTNLGSSGSGSGHSTNGIDGKLQLRRMLEVRLLVHKVEEGSEERRSCPQSGEESGLDLPRVCGPGVLSYSTLSTCLANPFRPRNRDKTYKLMYPRRHGVAHYRSYPFPFNRATRNKAKQESMF